MSDPALDAAGLAERMRAGSLRTRIFKAPTSFAPLRELHRAYKMLTGDVVRTKNRIKSMYRSRGVRTGGKNAVYSVGTREKIMKSLPIGTRKAVGLLCQKLDAQEAVKEEAQKAMISEARKHSAFKIVEDGPWTGFGTRGAVARDRRVPSPLPYVAAVLVLL